MRQIRCISHRALHGAYSRKEYRFSLMPALPAITLAIGLHFDPLVIFFLTSTFGEHVPMHDSNSRRECKNRGKRFPAEPLTPDEIKRLLRACSQRAPTGLRNRALLVTLYRGGLRLSEALSLQVKDFDIENCAIRILCGKGGTSRLIGLDIGALAIIEFWIVRRATLGLTGRSPVFCTLHGEPLKTAYVCALLPRLARKVGILRRVHAHALRHTHAFELAAEGVPINLIQMQLGHASLETTDRYIRHIHPASLVQTMRVREWRL